MAVIRANLTVLDLPPTTSEPGWAPRGHLRASFRDLTTVLHAPDFGIDATEDSTMWLLDTPAGRAQLCHQLDGTYFLHAPATRITWTIQAPSPDVLPWIFKLAGSTAGFPSSGQALRVGPDRITLIRAYQRFLDLRATDLQQRLELAQPQHPASVSRWQQLTSYHQHLSRVLHVAVAPADVVAALQQAANLFPAAAGPYFDHELHDEFVATVRALATASVPARSPLPAGGPR
ncbi:hypothetical protein ACIA5G_51260 [Amycolatopsis sp. NPDC051758]|uniref:hypothetical protein n=1 Tax=Amycolatopsis sp. NPDC051758 TaxID=3363935 RepID=UPI003789EDE2